MITKQRLEAFSDGVIAIIITIMVLEIKTPHAADLESLKPLIPVFISYVLSFLYVGIYWTNHHHMILAAKSVNGKILWANLNLLFWLSLIPFVTAWMGENHFARWPVIFYGIILILNSLAYKLLAYMLVRHHGSDSVLNKAIGRDLKGWFSIVVYGIAVAASFINSSAGLILYFLVAALWLIPDRRIERSVNS
ncbi:TMEM175 family protein [Arcticibacter sp. MXS-1]|uniref:TMEM175 family protein n=1 Tax=Arcticibacter sp. MXS-1 TaxID=3341726 RepID=UPI0035A9363D